MLGYTDWCKLKRVSYKDGEGCVDIDPNHSGINEFYARDISNKCRSAHRIRGCSGIPLSQPPYIKKQPSAVNREPNKKPLYVWYFIF